MVVSIWLSYLFLKTNENKYTVEEMIKIKNYLKEVGILEESEG